MAFFIKKCIPTEMYENNPFIIRIAEVDILYKLIHLFPVEYL